MTKNIDRAVERLMTVEIPGDSRQARQLARRQQITKAVMADGSIRIEELTERFDISLMTVHRDLDELIRQGIVRKTRGVVSAAPTSLIEASDVYRGSRQLAEKAAIAKAAVSLIEPGQAIFFDDSTTVLEMACHLDQLTPLTAITNSLTLMNKLKGIDELTLIGLGGQFIHWNNAFTGRATVNEISRLRADRFFVSMAAIIDGHVFHQSAEMVDTKRAMFDASQHRTLLTDHTKFDRRALHQFAALDEFDTVIVDDKTSDVHINRMRDRGINVVIAPVEKAGDGLTNRH